MRNDQIFVLLLVVLLPLSGCFDAGSIGEAEGTEDSTTEATVVNNYYNNMTQYQTEYLSQVGFLNVDQNLCENQFSGNWYSGSSTSSSSYCQNQEYVDVFTFTSNHTAVSVQEVTYRGANHRVSSICVDGANTHFFNLTLSSSPYSPGWMLPGSGSDGGCSHILQLKPTYTEDPSWSFVWSEVAVTLV